MRQFCDRDVASVAPRASPLDHDAGVGPDPRRPGQPDRSWGQTRRLKTQGAPGCFVCLRKGRKLAERAWACRRGRVLCSGRGDRRSDRGRGRRQRRGNSAAPRGDRYRRRERGRQVGAAGHELADQQGADHGPRPLASDDSEARESPACECSTGSRRRDGPPCRGRWARCEAEEPLRCFVYFRTGGKITVRARVRLRLVASNRVE